MTDIDYSNNIDNSVNFGIFSDKRRNKTKRSRCDVLVTAGSVSRNTWRQDICRQNIGQSLYFFLQLLQGAGLWVVLMIIHINVIGNEEMKSRAYNDS